jgi:hypothetical protein
LNQPGIQSLKKPIRSQELLTVLRNMISNSTQPPDQEKVS